MKNTNHLLLRSLRTIVTLFFLGIFAIPSQATEPEQILPDRDRKIYGVLSARYTDNNLYPQFIRFNQDLLVKPDEGISWLKKNLELHEATDFVLIRKDEDDLGYTHARYQQTIHGLPVIGGVYIIHSRDGRVETMNGELFSVANEKSAAVQVQENDAIATAMQHFPSELYGWEVRLHGHHETRSDYPKPELVYVPEFLDFTIPRFRAAYKMDVYALEPLKRAWIYVDAETGMIIAEENRICHIDEEGTAETNFSGTVTVTTDNTGSNYLSREDGRGIETLSSSGTFFTDADNIWQGTAGTANEWAMDAHYGAEVYNDMLLSDYGRNSMDDAGHLLTSNIYFGASFNNAFWDGSTATFGDGDGFQYTSFACPEIVGHEFQHGTTEFSAGLIYNSESGALNESFSDIFGHMTDIKARGAAAVEYIVGEQTVIGGAGIRNMSNPNDFNDPDTYGGTFWAAGNDVHYNSGVQNHWFYILSEGDTGVNDLGDSYSVAGLGTDAASQIAMRNLTYYLTPSSNYADAAFYAKQATIDIYGGCATEIAEVVNAWFAVGVGTEVSTEFSVNFAAPGFACNIPAVVEFQNLSTLAAEALWDFGDGTTSTDFTPVHTYTSTGLYDVKLTAVSCTGEVDSLTLFNYINVDPTASFCDTLIMQNSGSEILTECSGIILDPGGNGNYSNNIFSTLTINPGTDLPISLTFTEFSTESCCDGLYIYDGPDDSSPLIGVYAGGTLQGQIISSTGGVITLVFSTDGSVTSSGFVINFDTAGGDILPTAGFTLESVSLPLNAPITFTDNSMESGSYLYDFGDGVQSEEASPVHYYTSPGTYTVTQTVANCTGIDTFEQTVTVQAAGAMTIDPTSLCVTLLSGETSDETVVISNTGVGDLYYDFTLPSDVSEFTSVVNYTTDEAFTQHNFTEISESATNLTITVIINGDYDGVSENTVVSIEGAEVGTLGDDDEENGTDIIGVYTFTDATVIAQFLADGNLNVELQNSNTVDIDVDGTDTHTVIVTTEFPNFVGISPATGVVPAGGSIDVIFHFETAGLLGGTYEYDLDLQTGDPSQFETTYPVKLIVVGQPLIDVTPTALDYGDIFIGYPQTDSLCVNNPGTDSLFVTSITSSEAAFTVDESVFAVPPFGTHKVAVTFGSLTTGDFSGTLTIENNVNTVVVPVMGSALGAPISEVNPTDICITLLSGEMATEPVTISNIGVSDLIWEIDSESETGTIEVLAWLHGVDLDQEWLNTQTALNSTFTDYNLTTTSTTSAAELASELVGKHVLLIPESEFGNSFVYEEAGPIIEEYVSNQGGGVVFLMETDGNSGNSTGILPNGGTFSLSGSTLTPDLPDHPILEGVTAPLIGVNATNGCQFTDSDVIPILSSSNGFSVVAELSLGAGKVAYVGYDYFDYGDNEAIILGNAVQYVAVNLIPEWLEPTPLAGTVSAGNAQELLLNFDATGLATGTYEYDLEISTNEPSGIPIVISVKMNVIDVPETNFSAESTSSCDGTINFIDETLNVPSSWNWEFGDGLTSTEQNPIHTYTATGFYDVTLTTCNDQGCDTLTLPGYININLENAGFCDTLIMATSGLEILTECSGAILDPGGYGNYSNNILSTITIDPGTSSPISLTFEEFLTESCCDDVVIFDGPDTSSPIIGSYAGSSLQGQTITSTGGTITFVFDTDGSVTYSGFLITYSTANGDLPVTPGFAISDINPPLNAPVTFTDASVGAGSYLYTFGDGSQSMDASPVHSYTSPGTYTVTQIVSNCSSLDTLTQTLTVQEAGAMTINPTSLCVTLPAGDMSDEIVTITNTGVGDLFYGFTLVEEEENFSSLITYTFSENSTEHSFAEISAGATELTITVTVNGDYDNGTETATIFIEGTEVDVIGTTGESNGTDITLVFSYTDPVIIGELLADGVLNVNIQNSSSVDTDTGGNDTHEVIINAQVPSFFEVTPPTGIVSAGAVTEVNFHFDTEGLLGGTYEYDLPLQTGDPSQANILYPVKLIVVGQPLIEVTPTSIDFGDVFIGYAATDSLCISNPGTDDLIITNIVSSDAVFTVDETSLTIPPFSTVKVAVHFNPTVSGDLSGTFVIENNVGDVTVPINGSAMNAPISSVTPTDICVTLQEGETTTQTVTISNTGLSDLIWEIDAESGGTVEVLAWLYGVDVGEEWIGTQDALNSFFTDYNMTTTNTDVASTLETALVGKQLLLIPEAETGLNSVFAEAGPIIETFVNNGGGVVYLMSSSITAAPNSTGLMPYSNDAFLNGSPLTIFDAGHPLMEGVSTPLTGANATTGCLFSETDITSIMGTGDFAVVAERNIGAGKAVYLGYDYFDYGDNEAIMLANAVQYAAVSILPDWLEPTPLSGTVAGGSSQDVILNFDATGMLSGTYEYNLQINTNEPSGIPVTVSVKMIVTDVPQTAFSADNPISCTGVVNFTDESLNGPTSWNWQFGDGGTSTAQNPTHNYSESGTYDVTLEACNAIGCETFTISDYVLVNLAGSYCDTLVMPTSGSTILNSCTGVIYDNGGPEGNYSDNVEHTVFLVPTGAESISISFIEFELESCCDYVRIYDGPTTASPLIGTYNGVTLPNDGLPISSTGSTLTINFDSDGSVTRPGFRFEYTCAGVTPTANFTSTIDAACSNAVQFSNTSATADSYLWNFGDGTTSTEVSPFHHYSVAGDYSVSLTATNEFGSDIALETTTVAELPFLLEINAPLSGSVNSVVELSYSGSETMSEVLWDFGNGNTTTIENPSYIYLEEGQFVISLTGMTADGCQLTVYHTLDLLSDTDNPAILSGFAVFPNPTEGQVTIAVDLPNVADTELMVYNPLGQLLLQDSRKSTGTYRHSMDLSHLPAGQYFISLSVDGAPAGREILVIE